MVLGESADARMARLDEKQNASFDRGERMERMMEQLTERVNRGAETVARLATLQEAHFEEHKKKETRDKVIMMGVPVGISTVMIAMFEFLTKLAA